LDAITDGTEEGISLIEGMVEGMIDGNRCGLDDGLLVMVGAPLDDGDSDIIAVGTTDVVFDDGIADGMILG
jgi:hypothetical protein